MTQNHRLSMDSQVESAVMEPALVRPFRVPRGPGKTSASVGGFPLSPTQEESPPFLSGRFRWRNLGFRWKQTVLFLLAGLVPLLVVFGVSWFSFEKIRNLNAGNLQTVSEGIADRIDRNLFERYGDVQAFALNQAVRDKAIGFDEKYGDRIFEPFQRVAAGGCLENTGMGLALCRKIAERHGRAVTARSCPGQ
ncbi:MAG: hypothetical protein JSU88_12305 [Nitrospinaceae bacterium]|nr:MAG: hypothetical protein JSU88_12305 [Nitrospinaceae bacterium]